MARGDWMPGSKAVGQIIQVVVDDAGRVVHCGLGWHVQGPSGRILATNGGHTWGGPDQAPPEPWRSRLQECVDELRREALEAEGLT